MQEDVNYPGGGSVTKIILRVLGCRVDIAADDMCKNISCICEINRNKSREKKKRKSKNNELCFLICFLSLTPDIDLPRTLI